MTFTKTTVRRSGKDRRCDGYRCAGWIRRGDLYADCVAAPDPSGLGNSTWWRIRECETCCASAGRPITDPRPKPEPAAPTSAFDIPGYREFFTGLGDYFAEHDPGYVAEVAALIEQTGYTPGQHSAGGGATPS